MLPAPGARRRCPPRCSKRRCAACACCAGASAGRARPARRGSCRSAAHRPAACRAAVPGAGALLVVDRARPVRRWGRWCSSTARAGRGPGSAATAAAGGSRRCRAGRRRCRVRRRTRSPVRVRVEAMVATTTSWLVNGRPRQFMVIWENSRCSILFHLLVPGGKWQTVISRPVSAAKRRQLGLPEPVAVAVGAARVRGDQQPGARRDSRPRPRACHQRRIEATANAEVSWSTPTFTQPASAVRS